MDFYTEQLKKLVAKVGGYKNLASEIGANDQTIYQICTEKKLRSGNLKGVGPALRKKITDVYPDWLNDVIPAVNEQKGTYNVTPITPKGQRLPVVSWVQAGEMTEIREMYAIDEWVWAWHSNPSKRAFALRVDGDSMTSPYAGQLSFPTGTLLIVDPEREALAGDFVIAKDIATQQATFKKLMQDGGRWYLRALNPAYQAIEIDDPAVRVIARVIEYQLPGGKL